MGIRFLHTMIRVKDIDASLDFYCEGLGLKEVSRLEFTEAKFTLVFLGTKEDVEGTDFSDSPLKSGAPLIELTYNWDEAEEYQGGRNFGHLAYEVDNIFEIVNHLHGMGITINRPPRDGKMAFVKSPDGISVELLQKGAPLEPQAPWIDAPNIGEW